MRKFLSLALALVMVVSLFTMTTTASATDFTDDDSITYAEAIDVISGIGVVNGYSDGSFKPNAALTRGAAAKIICNMILGPSVANELKATTAPFKDVPTDHTFAGPISYCAQQGIISGYGDGSFRPGGTLSGYAFMKMLLGALGYKSDIEGFTGANWSINVAKIADGIGLTANVAEGFSGSSSVNREIACLFAFNTLTSDLVVYNQMLVGAGGVVTNQGSTATPKYWNSQSSFANGNNIVSDNIVQFGEEYFPRLVRNNGNFSWSDNWNSGSNTDDLGRPASTWSYRGESIGTYTQTADKTYIGDVDITTIYNDLGMTTATNGGDHGTGTLIINGVPYAGSYDDNDAADGELDVDLDGTIKIERNSPSSIGDFAAGFDFFLAPASGTTKEYYRNGDKVSSTSNYDEILIKGIKAADDDAADDGKIDKGTLVEVYRNDKTNDVVVAAISVYGGKVSAVREGTAKRDDYVEIEYGSNPDHAPVGMTDGGSKATNWFSTTGLEEDDVVLYTFSNSAKEIQSMKKLEAVEGALARRLVEKSLTLGETEYKYSKEYNFEFGLAEENLTNKSNYKVYLDDDGNALWIEEGKFNVSDYALIERISCEINGSRNKVVSHTLDDLMASEGPKVESNTQSIWDGNKARLLFSDGTEKTVDLDKSYVVGNTDTYGAKRTNDIGTTDSDVMPHSTAGSVGKSLDFWAGDIVRVTEQSNGSYRLTRVTRTDIDGFNTDSSSNPTNYFIAAFGGKKTAAPGPYTKTDGFATISNRAVRFNNRTVAVDSNTIFVVKVVNDNGRTSWQVYTGIKNAPTVEEGTAFAYMKGNLAKVVYITGGEVKNVSKDVTFVTGRSVSNLGTEADTSEYYYYNAVVRGEITTIMIAADADVSAAIGYAITVGEKPSKSAGAVLIANNYISDVDEIVTKLSYQAGDVQANGPATGIKPISDTEVRIGASNSNSGRIYSVASGVRVYLADNGGKIEAITMDDIKTSSTVKVYYTMDDGEITNLFIIETVDRD